ncbi:hypothetical protein CDG77_15125 [Nostoc sp. 'Peltigera membranacea cyanobiont' 213]|nr:hypothetical protein CDG77_15125 [Nostoc sp. 'Peltigera membranacea cyanobiont' 213]
MHCQLAARIITGSITLSLNYLDINQLLPGNFCWKSFEEFLKSSWDYVNSLPQHNIFLYLTITSVRSKVFIPKSKTSIRAITNASRHTWR